MEVAALPDQCAIRDSKNPVGPVLRLTRQQWSALLGIIKVDE